MKWPGSGFTARFTSSHCRLRFNAISGSYYYIRVDAGDFVEYYLGLIIDLTEQLDPKRKEHQIEVIKKNEPDGADH